MTRDFSVGLEREPWNSVRLLSCASVQFAVRSAVVGVVSSALVGTVVCLWCLGFGEFDAPKLNMHGM